MRALLIHVGHGAEGEGRHPRHHVAPIDLAQCAAILEQGGWQVDLWDTALTPGLRPVEVEQRVLARAPELLLVRPLQATVDTARGLLLATRRVGGLRLVLGPAAQHAADDLLGRDGAVRGADGALVGEPEGTLEELLPYLRRGALPDELPGLRTTSGQRVTPRPLLRDLDRLPLPAHRLLVDRGYRFRYPLDVPARLRVGYVLTSRGCALGCIFCAPVERETLGTRYRWRSADRVVDELELLRGLGANGVYFVDDFFGFSPQRIRDLCQAMLDRQVVLPWCAQVRAHGLDLDLLRLMRRAGCSSLCFGAESGSDRVLRLLRKGVTVDGIREQARRIRRAGVQLVGYFLVGTPGETAAERAQTYALIDELQPAVVQLHIFNVFPGAPAMEMFPERYQRSATKFTGPRSADPHMLELDREVRAFYRRYYLRPAYLARTVRRRWRSLAHNLGDEARFAAHATRFFLGSS